MYTPAILWNINEKINLAKEIKRIKMDLTQTQLPEPDQCIVLLSLTKQCTYLLKKYNCQHFKLHDPKTLDMYFYIILRVLPQSFRCSPQINNS